MVKQCQRFQNEDIVDEERGCDQWLRMRECQGDKGRILAYVSMVREIVVTEDRLRDRNMVGRMEGFGLAQFRNQFIVQKTCIVSAELCSVQSDWKELVSELEER